MSVTTSTNKKNLFDSRKMWFIFAGLASVTVAVLSFGIMQTVTATDTYYVLSKDVPARTQITPDLLTEEVTSSGKTPPTALDISEITDSTYSLYSLKAGDIVTQSNTGDLLSVTAGLPEDFVVASFTANPSIAAGGKVQRGDYIDIMAVSESTNGTNGFQSSYVLQRVLVVDATIDLDSYESTADDSAGTTATAGEDGETATESTTSTDDQIAQRSGIPTLFSVGLSQENAARLAVATKYDLFIVLSSSQSVNDDQVNGTPGAADTGSIFDGTAPNAGTGTDNTFGQSGEKEVAKPEDEATDSATPTDPATEEVDPNSGTEFGSDTETSDSN